ncbi:hypothetical protein [Paenibacillus xylaniclasticus]|uniref:hypothetical protein n=1 Tax=Paenibacillus xylaniclasticus TaxID=588083 RepID=UPI000FDC457B|nr:MULTISPECIES: hypothetical protein [Paenibacillus]GFN33295.1 hypothetical protein PCURB6_35550 [Paenibacillus curdlanolyticus]
MRNNKVRMVTVSALVLAMALSAGDWRNDNTIYASGGASLSVSADPESEGQDRGFNKKEQSRGYVGFRLFEDGHIAAVLGLTVDELSAELKAGKSLAQLAEERGADAAVVKLVIEAALQAKLVTRLETGKLTQEQYEKQAARLADFAAVLLYSKHGSYGAARA